MHDVTTPEIRMTPTTSRLSTLSLALSLALPLGAQALDPPNNSNNYGGTATSYRVDSGGLRVDSFGVTQQRELKPGSELVFSLIGTPGARVSLDIDGATGVVDMTEIAAGNYQGRYTVRLRDRLDAGSVVTAHMLKDGRAVDVTMDQSMIVGARSPMPRATAGSPIASFDIDGPSPVRPGDELKLTLTGAPGGRARVALQGVDRDIALPEVRSGVYEGRYTVRRADRLPNGLQATAFLTLDRNEYVQRLGGSSRGAATPMAASGCAQCGVVRSVNLVELENESADDKNLLGTIAGGVIGGVLGNQVGGGDGKKLATVAGAVGGAYAGNRVQNNMKKGDTVYRVVVQMDSGEMRTLDLSENPYLPVGSTVRIDDGKLIRR
jgi:outer membrane lipoprotein SlyB